MSDRGFTGVPNWIARNPDISATTKMVYLALASHADKKGRCWPSHELLANEAGCSKATVIRQLATLRDLGIVTWTRPHRHASNRYRVLIREDQAPPEVAPVQVPEVAPVQVPEVAPVQVLKELDPRELDPTPAGSVGDATADGAALPEPDEHPPPDPDALFAEAAVERVEPAFNGGHIVQAWWRAWKRGHPDKPRGPHKATLNRVKGKADEIAKVTDPEDWPDVLAAAEQAGERGTWDIVSVLADYRPPQRQSRNADMDRLRAYHQQDQHTNAAARDALELLTPKESQP